MHPAFMIKPENASPPESPDPGDPPEPMTPPDCDLRGMPFLPLDVVRLADSDFAALSTGEEFKAAVLLWCRAWNQLPAASLSSDERALARLSGAGRRWPLVREMALHGFVLCADGRLYHRVLAEKARQAWGLRVKQRERASRRWQRKGDAAAEAMPDPAADAAACSAAMQVNGNGNGNGKEEEEEPFPDGNAASAAPDPVRDLFELGIAVLGAKGVSEAQARRLVGRFRRDFGDGAVLDALNRCRTASDPVAAIRARLGKAKAQQDYFGP